MVQLAQADVGIRSEEMFSTAMLEALFQREAHF